jgi:alkylhydroperoxidase family enzyme
MSRLPAPTRDELAAPAQAIWDRLAAHRGGTVRGPSGILMNIPELADRVGQLEDYFRTVAELPAVDREIVILAVAREAEARFAWARHELRGRDEGVRPEVMEVLRSQGGADSLAPHERLLVELTRSLMRARTVPDALFARALDELGQIQLIEVVTLVGHYCLIGLNVNAFGIPEDSPTF